MPPKLALERDPDNYRVPISWDLEVDGQNRQKISSNVATNHLLFDPEDRERALVVVNGYGEGGMSTAAQTLYFLGALGIPAYYVVIDPRQTSSSDKLTIETYCRHAIGESTKQLQEKRLIPEKAMVYAHSMGGGMLAHNVGAYPDTFGDLGFAEPIAHDVALRTRDVPDPNKRRRLFGRQFGHVLFGPYSNVPLSDKISAASSLGSQLYRDTIPVHHRLRNYFELAVNLDAGPNVLAHAAAGNTVAYVTGSRDPLVQEEWIKKSLDINAGDDPELIAARDSILWAQTDNQHSYISWSTGREHLKIVTGLLGLHNQSEQSD